MCQLLSMNGNTPTDICFSFEGFRSRGGLTDVHRDGWGIDFSVVTTPNDRVAVIATQPLTDNETWQAMTPRTLAQFCDGELVRSANTV